MNANEAMDNAFNAARGEYETVIAMVKAASDNGQLAIDSPLISDGACALLKKDGYELKSFRRVKDKRRYIVCFDPERN